jgi:oxygen-independent coproporphyrinogen-3 oxidase
MDPPVPIANSLPAWWWPRAAYLHVPFCAHHCGYCDFAVATGVDHLVDHYLEALTRELSTLGMPQPVDTLFLGGGTPTHLSAVQLERLLSAVLHWLPPRPGHEFSVEANPESLDRDKVKVLVDHGVTRVSLGGQSFHPGLLQVLERSHDPASIPRAFDLLKGCMSKISLDLIFGVPGQTVGQMQEDLRQALALGPDHLSTYGLTYEKGTRLWKQQRLGQVQPLDEATELALYQLIMDTLEHAGFEHYEISSFARPGGRCRHNQVYWANEAYFGFGMGAARYVEGVRQLNTRDLPTYLKRMRSGQTATFQSECLAAEERARETIALNLRRAEGIGRGPFREQTGFDLDTLAGPAIQHVGLDLLTDDGVSVRLTRRGKCVADAVIRNLL